MSLRPLHALILAGIAAPLPWTMPVARAALGGSAAGIGADAAALHGDVVLTPSQAYDVHVISTTDGLLIREYADRSGTVFAVSWSGPFVPDLRRLLGARFDVYMTALAARTTGTQPRSLRVATADLVVEHGGHMRALSGRAWLPALVPAGVSVTDVR